MFGGFLHPIRIPAYRFTSHATSNDSENSCGNGSVDIGRSCSKHIVFLPVLFYYDRPWLENKLWDAQRSLLIETRPIHYCPVGCVPDTSNTFDAPRCRKPTTIFVSPIILVSTSVVRRRSRFQLSLTTRKLDTHFAVRTGSVYAKCT